MRRVLHILAFVVAVAVIVAAFIELDRRKDEDDRAIQPTILPSPSRGPLATDEEFTPPPVETEEPTASKTDAPASTPRRSLSPPRTPTPEPDGTPGPIVIGGERTPHTGASSAPAGIALALVALTGRALITRGRRSY